MSSEWSASGETETGETIPQRAAVHVPPQTARFSRQGASIALVLSIIAITMATSYVIMRAQFATTRVQQNGSRRALARQAAMIGISAGMRKMEESGWAGVNTTLSGNVSSKESYQVTYTTGDPLLTSSSAKYGEYPYRVTIQSIGYSVDPNNSQSRATYKMTAVMRFLPRQLATQPTKWSAMQNYTVYQTDNRSLTIDPPCQVSGPVYLQGAVTVGADYNWTSTIQQQYVGDLDSMRNNGYNDYRPLTGPVSLPTSSSSSANLAVLNAMSLTLTNISIAATVTLPTPNNLTTYRIYPGGQSYSVGTVASSISNTTLAPDPVSNPLGIFFNSSSVSIGNNVTITGTLISGGDVNITGSGVVINSFNLLPMSGTTAPVRLPAVVAKNNFYCNSTGQAAVNGVIVAGKQFWIDSGSQNNVVSVVGRVICGPFVISARTQWNLTATTWTTQYNAWKTVKAVFPFFPVYQSIFNSLNYIPKLTVTPDTTVFANHWFDLTTGPIYVINSTDAGLRWDLVDWRDNQ